ncbi:exported protein family 3 Plasmodium exported, putative [Plasmodium sp.]|nr:exported protein family 3 Plasmodium exported, putative [Plasmodium sp.]
MKHFPSLFTFFLFFLLIFKYTYKDIVKIGQQDKFYNSIVTKYITCRILTENNKKCFMKYIYTSICSGNKNPRKREKNFKEKKKKEEKRKDNTKEINVNNMENDMENNTDDTIYDSIDNSIDDSIDNSIDNSIENSIDDSIDNSIDDSIDYSIDDSIDNSIDDSMDDKAEYHNTLEDSIKEYYSLTDPSVDEKNKSFFKKLKLIMTILDDLHSDLLVNNSITDGSIFSPEFVPIGVLTSMTAACPPIVTVTLPYISRRINFWNKYEVQNINTEHESKIFK